MHFYWVRPWNFSNWFEQLAIPQLIKWPIVWSSIFLCCCCCYFKKRSLKCWRVSRKCVPKRWRTAWLCGVSIRLWVTKPDDIKNLAPGRHWAGKFWIPRSTTRLSDVQRISTLTSYQNSASHCHTGSIYGRSFYSFHSHFWAFLSLSIDQTAQRRASLHSNSQTITILGWEKT